MKNSVGAFLVLALSAAPAIALDTADPDAVLLAAQQSGICNPSTVASAQYNGATNKIEVTCAAPLVGGLNPAVAIGGVAIVLAAVAASGNGGGSTSDTQ